MKLTHYFLSIVLIYSASICSEEESETTLLLYQKINYLESEISKLRNLIEENSYSLERSKEVNKQRYLDLDDRMQALANSESINIDPSTHTEPLSEEILSYRNALENFDESKYIESLRLFREFIISYPDSDYAPEAYFWSGELFFIQGLLNDAKESYLMLIDKYIDHKRLPDSLYKLGEIARKQSDIKASKAYLLTVIKKYPDSSAALLSKKSLLIYEEESNLVD